MLQFLTVLELVENNKNYKIPVEPLEASVVTRWLALTRFAMLFRGLTTTSAPFSTIVTSTLLSVKYACRLVPHNANVATILVKYNSKLSRKCDIAPIFHVSPKYILLNL